MLRAIHKLRILHHVVSGMTLMGFAIAFLLAASPALHERMHHDADQERHPCLATDIDGGVCDNVGEGPITVIAFLNSILVAVSTGHAEWVQSVFASSSVFEHAPPFVS